MNAYYDTMKKEHLNAPMLMYVHRGKYLKYDAILDDYAKRYHA